MRFGQSPLVEFEKVPHLPFAWIAHGLCYVQDPSTLLPCELLDPQPGEKILDLCAAPGGKLSYIAQLMRNEGLLVAHDNNPQRLKLVEMNCARLRQGGARAVFWALLTTRFTYPCRKPVVKLPL